MNSIQDLANRSAIYLAAYKHYVEIKSKGGLLDVAIFGEPMARDLAEIAFGYKDLQNLNLGTSFPAVDLGSLAASCAIQVTITASTAKILETQQKFFEHQLDRTYTKLKFIILRNKKSTYDSQQIVRSRGTFEFDPYKDIYDLRDLFNILVREGNSAKFEAFSKRIEIELGSAIRPYLLGADRPGQNVRALLDAHDVRTTDAVESLKQFGMARAVYSNTISLSEISSRELIQYVSSQFFVAREWVGGEHEHIYSGGIGQEISTHWRRSLQGAYDLIEKANLDGEQLGLIIPAGVDLLDFDTVDDVLDDGVEGYERFFLVARKTNEFSVDRFRLVVSDPLSYKGCRNGIFLLFLAAEIYEIKSQQKVYVDVCEAPRLEIMSCHMGNSFLVDLYHAGRLLYNHKDFLYYGGGGALIATQKVPRRLGPLLQASLDDFVKQDSSLLPANIKFP